MPAHVPASVAANTPARDARTSTIRSARSVANPRRTTLSTSPSGAIPVRDAPRA